MRTKQVFVEAIQRAGLEQPARRVWDHMRASGLLPWASLVPENEFSSCAANALATLRRYVPDQAIGHYLEFGVSRGTSLACMYKVLQQAGLPHVHLVGFDSFEGLPPEAAKERWSPGSFKSTEGATRRYLTRAGVDWNRITLVGGWFRDTLNARTAARIRLSKASLIMIDCDIYSGSREALWFCAPYITDHAVLFFDDWWSEDEGEAKAFSEFRKEFKFASVELLTSYLPQARTFLVSRSTSPSSTETPPR